MDFLCPHATLFHLYLLHFYFTIYKYRGISDIFSGLTENKIYLGYGHKTSYWNKSTNKLPKEAWAQYGRVLYENNSDVLKMFEHVFTNFNDYAKMALKELV